MSLKKDIQNAEQITMNDEVRYFQFGKRAKQNSLPNCRTSHIKKWSGPWDPETEMKINYVLARIYARKQVDNIHELDTENPSYWDSVSQYWRRQLRRHGYSEDTIEKLTLRNVEREVEKSTKRFSPAFMARNKELIELYKKGVRVFELTELYELSPTRIYQIIRLDRRFNIFK